jgi:hypothetical protein
MANLNNLTSGLEQGLKGLLGQLIDGTIEDLDGPIRAIALRMSLAATAGRPDLVEESRDQLALIVREKQLRLTLGGAGLFETMLSIGINALVNGAIAGLAGLK